MATVTTSNQVMKAICRDGLCSSRQKPHDMTGCAALLLCAEFNHITTAVSKQASLSLGPLDSSSSSM